MSHCRFRELHTVQALRARFATTRVDFFGISSRAWRFGSIVEGSRTLNIFVLADDNGGLMARRNVRNAISRTWIGDVDALETSQGLVFTEEVRVPR